MKLIWKTLPVVVLVGCAHARSGENFFVTSADGSRRNGELIGFDDTLMVLADGDRISCVPRSTLETLSMEVKSPWRQPSMERFKAGGLMPSTRLESSEPEPAESPDGHVLIPVDLTKLEGVRQYARFREGPPPEFRSRCPSVPSTVL